MRGIITDNHEIESSHQPYSAQASPAWALALVAAPPSCSRSISRLTNHMTARSPANNRSKVRVKVSTRHQMVYVMEGSKALLVMPVSVGTSSTPTPKGHFRIFRKVQKHRANSHGYAYQGNKVRRCYLRSKPSGWSFKGTPMPYWCEFKAHYGFHTGWMKHQPMHPWLHPHA